MSRPGPGGTKASASWRAKNDEFVERELSEEPVSSAEVSYMGFYRTTGAQVIHRAPAAAEPGSPGLGPLQEASLPAGPSAAAARGRPRRCQGTREHAQRTHAGRLPADPDLERRRTRGRRAHLRSAARRSDRRAHRQSAKLDLTITPVVSAQPQGTRKRLPRMETRAACPHRRTARPGRLKPHRRNHHRRHPWQSHPHASSDDAASDLRARRRGLTNRARHPMRGRTGGPRCAACLGPCHRAGSHRQAHGSCRGRGHQ